MKPLWTQVSENIVLCFFVLACANPNASFAASGNEPVFAGGYLGTSLRVNEAGDMVLFVYAPDSTGGSLEISLGGAPTGVSLSDPDQDGVFTLTLPGIVVPTPFSLLLEVGNWPYLAVMDAPSPTPTSTLMPSNTPTQTPTGTPTATSVPTTTPMGTPTPFPTDTLTPTETPFPSETPTGTPTLSNCPSFDGGQIAGTVLNPLITEASGVAASQMNANVLWMHNDSGDSARIFAVGTDGVAIATYDLQGAIAFDWEDIAVGPGPSPGTTSLYVADCGDNSEVRTSFQVYRVPEPTVTPSLTSQTLTGVERFEFRYPDHPHNVETLLVDPITGDLYVVVKAWTGESPIFRARPPFDPLHVVTMELVTTLYFGVAPLEGFTSTTGGDISPEGDLIAIRTYFSAYAWLRPLGTTVDQAFDTAPCSLPLVLEGQGEALGFASDGGGYYTLSEGSFPELHFYERQ